jgi:hypothetical protein
MRRAPFVFLLLLVLAAPASAQERPKLAATLAACGTGREPEQRFAVFTGSMPARKGTYRMSMRFDLEEIDLEQSGASGDQAAAAMPERVAAPKLSRWNRSKPGVAGFVYTKRVTKLAAGRWYRAVVRFRWHDRRGRLQRAAKRVTPFCHQPDQRPNLTLESLSRPRPGAYLVTIVNTGMTAAPESTVAVEPRPGTDFQRPVPPLAPGERTSVVVEADPCQPSSVVVVQLDRHRVVDESREDDDRVEVACPAADRLG